MHKEAIAVWDPASGKPAADIPLPTRTNDLSITASGHVFYTWGAANAVFHQRQSPSSNTSSSGNWKNIGMPRK